MVRDLLRHFQLTAVLQIRRDAGGTESVIANARFDAGGFRAPADDAVGVRLEKGIGGELAARNRVRELLGDDISLWISLNRQCHSLSVQKPTATPKTAQSILESAPPARPFLA
jgi:hypothetical protein